MTDKEKDEKTNVVSFLSHKEKHAQSDNEEPYDEIKLLFDAKGEIKGVITQGEIQHRNLRKLLLEVAESAIVKVIDGDDDENTQRYDFEVPEGSTFAELAELIENSVEKIMNNMFDEDTQEEDGKASKDDEEESQTPVESNITPFRLNQDPPEKD